MEIVRLSRSLSMQIPVMLNEQFDDRYLVEQLCARKAPLYRQVLRPINFPAFGSVFQASSGLASAK